MQDKNKASKATRQAQIRVVHLFLEGLFFSAKNISKILKKRNNSKTPQLKWERSLVVE